MEEITGTLDAASIRVEYPTGSSIILGISGHNYEFVIPGVKSENYGPILERLQSGLKREITVVIDKRKGSCEMRVCSGATIQIA